jgi:mannan endo-1,4-beta-mannosidase
LATLGAGATSYTDNTVVDGSTYQYALRGNYSAGGSTADVTASASVNSGDGSFRIVGTQILDPDGAEFWPKGANTTLMGHFTGDCRGHAGDAAAWGWNMVRLCIYATARHSWSVRRQSGYSAVTSAIDQVVQEYTAAGIVVMIQAHDFTGDLDNPSQIASQYFTEMSQFWVDMANAYKNNTYVWLNPVNEPCWSNNTNWYNYNRQYLQSIRAQGAENVVVIDTMNMGQDAAWDGAKRVYDPSMGPAVMSGYQDVIFAVHAYGADTTSGSTGALTTYSDNVAAAGLAYLFGEFGHTIDGSSTAGTYQQNVNGVNSVFAVAPGRKLGMLWWHGEHNDKYSLKSSGGAFYSSGGPGAGLSPAGQDFWDICH